jgi:hypothetical protein
MRSRWLWLALGSGVLLLIGVAYGVIQNPGGRPAKLQLTVVDQHVQGDALIISVVTSNVGSAVLINGGNYDVRYRIDGAWSTNSFPGFRSCIFWLLPGQMHTEQVRLSRGVSRFRVGATYEVAHGRVAAACRLYSSPLPHRISEALANAVSLLPYHPGPYIEFWDDEHEVRTVAN